MYIIIPASEMTQSNTLKTLECVSGLPILQHILDELYSYQEHVDKIVIPTQDVEAIQEYIDYSVTDEFLRTKICVINGKTATLEGNMYAAVEHLVDCLRVRKGFVLVWNGSTLAKNTFKLTDLSEGSFVCTQNKLPVGIYRFDDITYLVNILVKFSFDNTDNSMNDILREYYLNDEIKMLENFGTYYDWQSADGYFKAEADFNEASEHSKVSVKIDREMQTLSKHNKFADLPYSHEVHQKSKKVQAMLFGEQDFLSKADAEQALYLPRLVSIGITLAGEFLDDITEEWIPYQKLDSFLVNSSLSDKEWSEVLNKLVKVLSEVFHKDGMEYDEMIDSIVPKKIRNQRLLAFKDKAQAELEAVQNMFCEGFWDEYYYTLSPNDVAEWKMFFDKLFELQEKMVTQENTLYQGVCERRVHGSLSFDNIAYDKATGHMKFLSPHYKAVSIMHTLQDYAYLYTSCFVGIHALERGKYKNLNGSITLQKSIKETMDACTQKLDYILGAEIAEFCKMLAIYITLSNVANNAYDAPTSIAVMKFLNQLRTDLYWDKLIG